MTFEVVEKMLIAVVAAIVHHVYYFKKSKFSEFFNMLDEAVDGFVCNEQEFENSKFFQEYTKIARKVYSGEYSEEAIKKELLELCNRFEENIMYPDP